MTESRPRTRWWLLIAAYLVGFVAHQSARNAPELGNAWLWIFVAGLLLVCGVLGLMWWSSMIDWSTKEAWGDPVTFTVLGIAVTGYVSQFFDVPLKWLVFLPLLEALIAELSLGKLPGREGHSETSRTLRRLLWLTLATGAFSVSLFLLSGDNVLEQPPVFYAILWACWGLWGVYNWLRAQFKPGPTFAGARWWAMTFGIATILVGYAGVQAGFVWPAVAMCLGWGATVLSSFERLEIGKKNAGLMTLCLYLLALFPLLIWQREALVWYVPVGLIVVAAAYGWQYYTPAKS